MQPCRKDTTAGIVTFASDPNGNLTSRVSTTGSTAYSWDFLDWLTQVSDGVTAAQYVHNGVGTRLARRINGVTTRFVVDPQPTLSQLLVETDETGTATGRYVYGLGLISRVDASGQVAFYHFDPRGSTVAMTDPSQAVVNTYAYDEFGAVLSKQQTLAQSFNYVGQFGVMQEPNGLLFMRARYYDTAIGRFLSRDPAPAFNSLQDLNFFSYVNNSPIALIDARGLSPHRSERGQIAGSRVNGATTFWGPSVLVSPAVGQPQRVGNVLGTAIIFGLPDKGEVIRAPTDDERIQWRYQELQKTDPLLRDACGSSDSLCLVRGDQLLEQARRDVLGPRSQAPEASSFWAQFIVILSELLNSFYK